MCQQQLSVQQDIAASCVTYSILVPVVMQLVLRWRTKRRMWQSMFVCYDARLSPVSIQTQSLELATMIGF